jgi:hypothetical protein
VCERRRALLSGMYSSRASTSIKLEHKTRFKVHAGFVRDTVHIGVSTAVLMTGDTCSVVAELPRDPHLRVAGKPIDADELLTLLRRALLAV